MKIKPTLTYLSNAVPGTLLDNEWACPKVSFFPAGNPMGMEEEGCKERPGSGTSLDEESGNQNGCFMRFHRGQLITSTGSRLKARKLNSEMAAANV